MLFVNASEDAETTSPGTAVVIPVLDNDNASTSLLPLVVEPGSVTSPSPSGTAVITTDNKIRYTPATGAENLEATFNYTAKPGSAATPTSTALVRVQVTGTTDPLPGGDYPNTANTVTLSSPGTLMAQYNSVALNTTIWLPAGDYTGTFNFNRNGLIVMRPVNNNWLGPKFKNKINISGTDNVFVGADVLGTLTGDIIIVSGSRSRVSRCKVNRTTTSATSSRCILLNNGTGMRVDRCDVMNKFGTGNTNSEEECIRLGTTANLPTAPIIEYNWIHDCNGHAGVGGKNGYEGLQLGEGRISGTINVNAIVRYNLFENCLNESETISVKSSGNTLTNNIMRNCKDMVSRAGSNNKWIACRSENSGGFVMWQNGHQYTGCVVQGTGGGKFELHCGDTTVAAYDPATSGTTGLNMPAPEDCKLYHCTGLVEIARQDANHPKPPRNNTVWSHASQADIKFLSPNHVNTDITGTAPGTKPTILNLTSGTNGNVGPFAP